MQAPFFTPTTFLPMNFHRFTYPVTTSTGAAAADDAAAEEEDVVVEDVGFSVVRRTSFSRVSGPSGRPDSVQSVYSYRCTRRSFCCTTGGGGVGERRFRPGELVAVSDFEHSMATARP